MLISIKLCTHIERIDGEVAEIPRMLQLSQFIMGEFPLHYNVDSFCASEIVCRYHEVSTSIARVWQILCSKYPFYHGNY
jgi:hypothetical protein